VQAAFRYGVFPKYHRKSLREKGLARQGDSSILTVDNLGMEGRSVMSRQGPLYAWMQELTKTFPDLSKPQLKGLAEWTFGMILARCCSLGSVASYLADWLEQPQLSVRSRLRECYLPADCKSRSICGEKRKELSVHTCFAPLLRWLQRDWPVSRLALALDASTL